MNYKYDVALSFAGEDSEHAIQVSELLRTQKVKVFDYKIKESEIWGKDLYDYLARVYAEQSKYTVIFYSKHYANKPWTNHERQAAQSRALVESREYILPVKLDNTKIPSQLRTKAHFDLRMKSVGELCNFIIDKLNKLEPQTKKTYKKISLIKSLFDSEKHEQAITHFKDTYNSSDEDKLYYLLSYLSIRKPFSLDDSEIENLYKKIKSIKENKFKKISSRLYLIIYYENKGHRNIPRKFEEDVPNIEKELSNLKLSYQEKSLLNKLDINTIRSKLTLKK